VRESCTLLSQSGLLVWYKKGSSCDFVNLSRGRRESRIVAFVDSGDLPVNEEEDAGGSEKRPTLYRGGGGT